MYSKILVAVAPEHNETLGELLEAARALASPGATIEALSVVTAVPTYIEVHVPKSIYEETAREVSQKLEEALSDHDDISPVVRVGRPAQQIEAYREEGGHDLIVLRSHDPAVGDFLIGTTAGRIVRNAKCAVHVIR